MARYQLEIANFICTMQEDERVLLDLFDDYVYPAFQLAEIRETSTADYFFHQVKLLRLDANLNSLAVVGKLVKNTLLKRVQTYDRGKKRLIPNPLELETAPSTIFALLLTNHRLLLVREEAGAPTAAAFQTTMRVMLRRRQLALISEALDAALTEGRRLSKKQASQDAPCPHLDIVQMLSKETAHDIIERCAKITSVRVEMVDTNAEIDMNDFWKSMRKVMNEADSRVTNLSHSNRDGLDKKGAERQLAPAIAGHAHVEIKGVDERGATLRLRNEDVMLKSPLALSTTSPSLAAKQMYREFLELINSGSAIVGEQDATDTTRKLKEIENRTNLK